MTDYPASRWLVSSAPPVISDDFTTVRSMMRNGLPHIVDLTSELRLVATLATGVLRPWVDADPTWVVATSDDECQPRPGEPSEVTQTDLSPSLRLSAIRAGSSLSAIPATAGTRRSVTDSGATDVAIEMILSEWTIHAGTVRGPGDFGSFIHFAWRTAALGENEFLPPVINPFLRRRLASEQAMHSELGADRTVLSRRFARRRLTTDARR